MIILNPELYEEVKKQADEIYKKASAYKSGYIIREYKRRGGEFGDDNKEKPLKRWFKEKWTDIGNLEYPVYRPTVRINKKTPLTVNEIDKDQAIKQIQLKQIIKGEKNLPKFIKKNTNDNNNMSNWTAYNNHMYFKPSTRKNKKYDVFDEDWNYLTSFGDKRYQHYKDRLGYYAELDHLDDERRKRYIARHKNDNKLAGILALKMLW